MSTQIREIKSGIKPFLVYLQVALMILFYPSSFLMANPYGEQVVGGSASFGRPDAQTFNVHQHSQRAIINYQGFSIDPSEVTQFFQPNSQAAVLNRVISGNPSQLLGTLRANGQVFLINPNGILVGQGAHINVGAFTASTLDINNAEFMRNGDLSFIGDSKAGIKNLGQIDAKEGDIFLISHQVENIGELKAEQGTVGLAAGNHVLLAQVGRERLQVIPAILSDAMSETGVVNKGAIEAAQVELKAAGNNIYALAINNEGNIRATGYEEKNGRVTLKAMGGNINHSGTISASNPNGSGGEIEIAGGVSEIEPATVSITGLVLAPSKTKLAKGGKVKVTGQQVALTQNAKIDVSGDAGGGEVLVGGDYQGKNPEVQNAERTYVGSNTEIKADALTEGDGGKVVVWSDNWTKYYGSASARGGEISGDGGLIEISGKEDLAFEGFADVAAPYGVDGTILLDPRDITIGSTGGVGDAAEITSDSRVVWEDGDSGDFAFRNDTLAALSGRVILQAKRDIDVESSTAITNGGAITDFVMQAGENITFEDNSSVDFHLSPANIHLEADSPHSTQNPADGSGTLSFGDNVSIVSGNQKNITLIANDFNIGSGSYILTYGAQGSVNLARSNEGVFSIGGAGSTLLSSDFDQIWARPIPATTPNGTVVIGQATTAGADGMGGQLLTNSSITVDAITIGPSLTTDVGEHQFVASQGITLNEDLGVLNPLTFNADVDGDGVGTFTLNAGTMATGYSTYSVGDTKIIAADVVIDPTAVIQVFSDVYLLPSQLSDTIALNDATGTFSVSEAELQAITGATNVFVGNSGQIGAMNIGSLGAIDLSAETYDLELNAGATQFNTNGLTLGNDQTLTFKTAGITGSGSTDVTIGGTAGKVVIDQGSQSGNVDIDTAIDELQATDVNGDLTIENSSALSLTGASNVSGTANIRSASLSIPGSISAVDVNLLPLLATDSIALNDATGTYYVSTASLLNISTPGTVTIGNVGQTGPINIGSQGAVNLHPTSNYDLTLYGGAVTTNAELRVDTNHTLTMYTGGISGPAYPDISVDGAGRVIIDQSQPGDVDIQTIINTLEATYIDGGLAIFNQIIPSYDLALDTSNITGYAVIQSDTITDIGTLNIGGELWLRASSGIQLDDPNSQFGSVEADTTTGNIEIFESGNMDIIWGKAVSAPSGNVILESTGDMNVGYLVEGTDITLISQQNMTVGAAPPPPAQLHVDGSGNVSLQSTNNMTINQPIEGGTMGLLAGGALDINADVTSTSSGVTLRGVGIDLSNTTTIDGGTGLILIDAGGAEYRGNSSVVFTTSGSDEAIKIVNASLAEMGNTFTNSGGLVVGENHNVLETIQEPGTSIAINQSATGSIGGNLTWDNDANGFGVSFGPFDVLGNLTLRNWMQHASIDRALDLRGLSVGGDLRITSYGPITDSSPFSQVTGSSFFYTGNNSGTNGDIYLDNFLFSGPVNLYSYVDPAAGVPVVSDGDFTVYALGDLILGDVITNGNTDFGNNEVIHFSDDFIGVDPVFYANTYIIDPGVTVTGTNSLTLGTVDLNRDWAFNDAAGEAASLDATEVLALISPDLRLGSVDATGTMFWTSLGDVTFTNIGELTTRSGNMVFNGNTVILPNDITWNIYNQHGTINSVDSTVDIAIGGTTGFLNIVSSGDTYLDIDARRFAAQIASDLVINNAGPYDFFAPTSVSGNLFATAYDVGAGAAITDSADITVGGRAEFVTEDNAGSPITLGDTTTLTVGQDLVARTFAADGSTPAAGTITITEFGAMNIGGITTTDDAILNASDEITQVGPIVADDLDLTSGAFIDLQHELNAVNELLSVNSNGYFKFFSLNNLEVQTVSTGGPPNDVELRSAGNLRLNDNIDAWDLKLTSDFGDIVQLGGSVFAFNLEAYAPVDDILLNLNPNQIFEIKTMQSGGDIEVFLDDPFTDISGPVDAVVNAQFLSLGSVTVSGDISALFGSVGILAEDSILQTSDSIISAGYEYPYGPPFGDVAILLGSEGPITILGALNAYETFGPPSDILLISQFSDIIQGPESVIQANEGTISYRAGAQYYMEGLTTSQNTTASAVNFIGGNASEHLVGDIHLLPQEAGPSTVNFGGDGTPTGANTITGDLFQSPGTGIHAARVRFNVDGNVDADSSLNEISFVSLPNVAGTVGVTGDLELRSNVDLTLDAEGPGPSLVGGDLDVWVAQSLTQADDWTVTGEVDYLALENVTIDTADLIAGTGITTYSGIDTVITDALLQTTTGGIFIEAGGTIFVDPTTMSGPFLNFLSGLSQTHIDVDYDATAGPLTMTSLFGDVTIDSQTLNSDVRATGGNVEINAPSGSVTIDGDPLPAPTYVTTVASVTDNVEINASVNVDIDRRGVINADDDIIVDAATGDLQLDGDLTTTLGDVSLSAGNDIFAITAASINAGNDINVAAGNDLPNWRADMTAGNDIFFDVAGSMTAGSGSQMFATGNLTADVDGPIVWRSDILNAVDVLIETNSTLDHTNLSTITATTVTMAAIGAFDQSGDIIATGNVDLSTNANYTQGVPSSISGNDITTTALGNVTERGDKTASGTITTTSGGTYEKTSASVQTADAISVTSLGQATITGGSMTTTGNDLSIHSDQSVTVESGAFLTSENELAIDADDTLLITDVGTLVGARSTINLSAGNELNIVNNARVSTGVPPLNATVNLISGGGILIDNADVYAWNNVNGTAIGDILITGSSTDVTAVVDNITFTSTSGKIEIDNAADLDADDELTLTAEFNVNVQGASTLTAGGFPLLDMTLTSLSGDVNVTEGSYLLNNDGDILFNALSNDITVDASTVDADKNIVFSAFRNVNVTGGALVQTSVDDITFNATNGKILVNSSTVDAENFLTMTARENVDFIDATLLTDTDGDISVTSQLGKMTIDSTSNLDSDGGIALASLDDMFINNSTLTADDDITGNVTAGKLTIRDATITAGNSGSGVISFTALDDVLIDPSDLSADDSITISTTAGAMRVLGDFGDPTTIHAGTDGTGGVNISALKDVLMEYAEIFAGENIDIVTTAGGLILRDSDVYGGYYPAVGGGAGSVYISSLQDMLIDPSNVSATNDITIESTAGGLTILGTAGTPTNLYAGTDGTGTLRLFSLRDLFVLYVDARAGTDIDMEAVIGDITTDESDFTAGIGGDGDIIAFSFLDLLFNESFFTTTGDIFVESTTGEVLLRGTSGNLTELHAGTDGTGLMDIEAPEDVTVEWAFLDAGTDVDIESKGGSVEVVDSTIDAGLGGTGDLRMLSLNELTTLRGNLSAADSVDLESTGSSMTFTNSFIDAINGSVILDALADLNFNSTAVTSGSNTLVTSVTGGVFQDSTSSAAATGVLNVTAPQVVQLDGANSGFDIFISSTGPAGGVIQGPTDTLTAANDVDISATNSTDISLFGGVVAGNSITVANGWDILVNDLNAPTIFVSAQNDLTITGDQVFASSATGTYESGAANNFTGPGSDRFNWSGATFSSTPRVFTSRPGQMFPGLTHAVWFVWSLTALRWGFPLGYVINPEAGILGFRMNFIPTPTPIPFTEITGMFAATRDRFYQDPERRLLEQYIGGLDCEQGKVSPEVLTAAGIMVLESSCSSIGREFEGQEQRFVEFPNAHTYRRGDNDTENP
ncbi:filamentous hemagglutinin N-terminal domain-containing protein [Bdellovibrionota bacterium]